MRAYFWIKHIGDSIHCSVQQQASDEENKENHVGEDGGEVHNLKFGKKHIVHFPLPKLWLFYRMF